MGFAFFPLRLRAPRALFQLRWRVALVLCVTAFCHQQHLFVTSRQSLAAKYSPTEFDFAPHQLQPKLGKRDKEADFQGWLIETRESWKTLSEGWEGKVFAYQNSVIKTFTPGRSPFRNCAPEEPDEKWPTEIAASLRFGGYRDTVDFVDSTQGYDAETSLEGFLPVKTYFKAAVPPSEVPEWHLVTPLLKGGNLNNLANKTSHTPKLNTTRQIDARYRPTFNRLLRNMQRLHDAKYCHDDIKPANIFIRDDTHWMLGDLGNIRHVSHPYHSSQLWTDNKQLRDCRANDAVRALKSYLQFLRAATNDKDGFDTELYQGEEPLSKLYWGAMANAPSMRAEQLRSMSRVEKPEKIATRPDGDLVQILQAHPPPGGVFKKSALRKAVDKALETRMGEKLVRWWGMAGVLGVPSEEVCGF
jgi:hypothetical protein